MKTILYSTDFSENSAAALNYSYSLSQQLDARLVITHVFDYPTILGLEGLDEPFPHLEENAFEANLKKLNEFCKKHLGKKIDNPNIQLEVVEDTSVTNGIISKAQEWNAFMVVVGMRGSSVLREMVMGNTTKHLIKKAPCPVLAIPSEIRQMTLQTIVYATDFEEEDIYAIKKLVELAKPIHAKIKVVHIVTKKEYSGDLQMAWFKEMLKTKVDYPKINFELIVSENVFGSLKNFIGDNNGDLIVMLEREHKGLVKKIFHDDLVKKMESYGKVPLMSFNEHNYQNVLL
tara:strand:- start:43131 stop:43994 length:864 start_codon:yes stop_codon:yes gene_type:complete